MGDLSLLTGGVQPAQDDPSEGRAKVLESSCVPGAHANPTSGSWPTRAQSRTSQVRSHIRCSWILRDYIDAAGRPVASWTPPAIRPRSLRECA